MISPVLKLSPATLALSVVFIPPITVKRANGTEIGRYFKASPNP